MKRKSIFKLCSVIAAMAVSLAVASCCDYESDNVPPVTEPEPTPTPSSGYSSTTTVPNGYNFGIVNDNNGNAYFVTDANGDRTGDVSRIGFVINDPTGTGGTASSNGTAIFAGQKVRSMTINGVTYTFHENENGKVDVAITRNNITELYTDVAASQLLGDGYDAGTSFSNKLAYAFSKVNSATDIISAANALVNPNSVLYPYIQEVERYIKSIKNDTGKLGDGTVTSSLTENPSDTPIDTDTSGTEAADSTANSNTNTGNGAIASGKGALKVTLTWFFNSDIDLHVYEPGYNSEKGHIYYSHKTNTFTDGFLDIDNTVGYYINPLNGERNMSLSAVENIYWPEHPSDGTFDIYLDNFSHVRSGLCNLAIYKDGKSIYSQDVMIATTDRNRYIVSVTMPQGEITTKTRSAASVAPMDYWLFPEKK